MLEGELVTFAAEFEGGNTRFSSDFATVTLLLSLPGSFGV